MSRARASTDTEFAAAWEERPPEPFVYTSSTEYYDDHRQETIEAWQRIRARWGQELKEVLAAIVSPDIRVVVRGSDGRDFQSSKRSIRILATRKGDDAYLITQESGKTLWHAEGFTIPCHQAPGSADAVVGALTEAAGRRADFASASGDGSGGMDYSCGRSAVRHRDDDLGARVETFDNVPASSAGTISTAQGYSRRTPGDCAYEYRPA